MWNLFRPVGEIFAEFWKAAWITVLVALMTVIAAALCGVAGPYVFSRFVDVAAAGDALETLVHGALIYAVFLGCSLGLGQAVAYLSMLASQRIGLVASIALFKRLARKRPEFFIERNPSEIQSAQTQGTSALTTVLHIGMMIIAPGMAQTVLALSMLGYTINVEIAAAVFVYGLIFIGLAWFGAVRSRVYLDAAMQAEQGNARLVGNALGAMETLRFSGSVEWISDRFNNSARDIFRNWRSYCAFRLRICVLYGAALAAQVAICFTMLIPGFTAGELSIGELVLFNTLLLQLNVPFQMTGSAIDDLTRAAAKLRVFLEIWSAPEESREEGAVALPAGAGELEFRNVSFSYPDGRGVRDISFRAERGRITFITGKTGAGKSTILKLALRSLDPDEGQILFNGHDARGVSRSSWLGSVGVVPQDILLLNDRIDVNIALGRPVEEERLRGSAERAAILDRIEDLPDGFAAIVGERGLKLSGGERQRIAIARALYSEPGFLILDEASSALDEATEREIMDYVRRLASDVTVLVVTHRKSAIRPEDNVIEL